MKTRKLYDSSVAFLYATGRENLLPLKFRRSIPYATIHDWRHTDYTKYVGHEFRKFFDASLINLELRSEYLKTKQALLSVAGAWFKLRHLLLPTLKDAGNNKDTQKTVLKAIERLRVSFGLRKALNLIGISHSVYRQWAIEVQFNCIDSYTAICTKRHPHQLSRKEVLLIRKFLLDPSLDHWPIVSVAAHGVRTGKIIASQQSWYKYARLFGIQRKVNSKEHKTEGLVATYVNEYWHVDTTMVSLINGKKMWIAFVLDNYSKLILGFHVLENRTFAIVKEALRKALKVALEHPGEKDTKLITDGGSENHNRNISRFLNNLVGYKLTKLRALKDIQFSNSAVEAINNTMKNRYLRRRKFEDISALRNYLSWAVNDYNMERPHYKHPLRTPYEAYFNIPLKFDKFKRKKNALEARLKVNRCVACKQCTDFITKKECSGDNENCPSIPNSPALAGILRSTEDLVLEKPEMRSNS